MYAVYIGCEFFWIDGYPVDAELLSKQLQVRTLDPSSPTPWLTISPLYPHLQVPEKLNCSRDYVVSMGSNGLWYPVHEYVLGGGDLSLTSQCLPSPTLPLPHRLFSVKSGDEGSEDITDTTDQLNVICANYTCTNGTDFYYFAPQGECINKYEEANPTTTTRTPEFTPFTCDYTKQYYRDL